ncbi:attachment glycoprotein [Wufeng Chodsigoa smithii henipavirus 1]|nr:attachment glycoprotein [Wufeng Chodsigoa smithii henipavirus 1]
MTDDNKMVKVGTETTTPHKYYGVEKVDNFAGKVVSNRIFILTNMILIITSSIVAITLNVTNLESLYNQRETLAMVNQEVHNKLGDVSTIGNTIKGDIKPKVNLINSAVSVSLPAQMSSMLQKMLNKMNGIEDAIDQRCSCSTLGSLLPGSSQRPPTVSTPGAGDDDESTDTDSGSVTMIDLSAFTKCTLDRSKPYAAYSLTGVAHNIPGLSVNIADNGDCVSNVAFAISEGIYVYTQEIRKTDCLTGQKISQITTLGRIVDKGQSGPRVSPLSTYLEPDPSSKISCSVAASSGSGWVFCVLTTGEGVNYSKFGPFIGFTLSHITEDGDVTTYNISLNVVNSNYAFKSIFIGPGNGIVRGNNMYFVGYGALRDNTNYPSWCIYDGCPADPSYNKYCEWSMRPDYFGRLPGLNCIITITNYKESNRGILIRAIPNTNSYPAAGGRLYDLGDRVGLYFTTASWQGKLQFALFEDFPSYKPIYVNSDIITVRAHGSCRDKNNCPQDCYSPLYADIYPLNLEATLFTSTPIFMGGDNADYRTVIINSNKIESLVQMFVNYKSIMGTTTTCFMYKDEPWCIVTVRGVRKGYSGVEAISYSYKIKKTCQNTQPKIGNISIPDFPSIKPVR